MPKPLVIAAISAIVAALLALLYFSTLCACDHEPTQSPTAAAGANANVTPPALPTACGPNPSPAVNVAPTEFGYRKLTSPASEAPTSSPLRIAGEANPFEGAYSVTIFDRQGLRVATQEYLKDNRTLDFQSTLSFEVARPMPACVWVHERSGRDGTPTNITQIPVLLVP